MRSEFCAVEPSWDARGMRHGWCENIPPLTPRWGGMSGSSCCRMVIPSIQMPGLLEHAENLGLARSRDVELVLVHPAEKRVASLLGEDKRLREMHLVAVPAQQVACDEETRVASCVSAPTSSGK